MTTRSAALWCAGRGRFGYASRVSYPFVSWMMIDRLSDEPVIAFVYLDAHVGPSVKGGLASQHDLGRDAGPSTSASC